MFRDNRLFSMAIFSKKNKPSLVEFGWSVCGAYSNPFFPSSDSKTKSDLMSLTRLAGLDDIFSISLRLLSLFPGMRDAHRLVFADSTYPNPNFVDMAA